MTRRYNVKACRESNGKSHWAVVGTVFINEEDGSGSFYPYWLPDVTYRLFEETAAEKSERESRRRR